ncbi:MAG TPA: 6-bladed beta-propeller [Longimicrobiaceae bacterium]|nr:6-bladed beta-propeller [Longimicrobiaceae bacterium]
MGFLMSRQRTLLPTILNAAVLLAGCAAQLAAQQVVRMPGRDVILRREMRTLFTVGRAEGGGADVFGAVGDVGFDAAENLYVLDRLNAHVVVFDSTGRFVRTMGRRGGGPGEFGAPQQLAVTRGGDVIVSDAGRRALVVFGRDGAARSVAYPGASFLIGRALLSHPKGGVVGLAMGNPTARNANAFGEEVLLWLPVSGGTPRSLATVSTPTSRGTQTGSVTVYTPPIFSPAFRFAVLSGGGVAVVDNAEYAVRILDPAGRVLRILQRPIAPRAVSSRDRAYERERRARQLSEGGGLRVVGPQGGPVPPSVRATVGEQLRDAEFARVMPVIRRIAVDPAGNLWIERTGSDLARPGSVDLVGPRGTYLGTLPGREVPAAFSPGGRVAFVREDSLGIQRVVVMRQSSPVR